MQEGKDATFPRHLWDLLPEESKRVSTAGTTPKRQLVRARPVPPTPQHPASTAESPEPIAAPRRDVIDAIDAIIESPHRDPRQQAPLSTRERYDALVKLMKDKHHVRVRKWRSNNTGCAWQVVYADGRVSRLIEAPYPRGPVSAAVFLHEVGHHAIGFTRYKPRCFEEYKAWEWALESMEEHAVTITDRVRTRVELSLRYAVAKARRRGLKRLPVELLPFL